MIGHLVRDVERTEYLLKRNDEANGVELTMLELADNEVKPSDLTNSSLWLYSQTSHSFNNAYQKNMNFLQDLSQSQPCLVITNFRQNSWNSFPQPPVLNGDGCENHEQLFFVSDSLNQKDDYLIQPNETYIRWTCWRVIFRVRRLKCFSSVTRPSFCLTPPISFACFKRSPFF